MANPNHQHAGGGSKVTLKASGGESVEIPMTTEQAEAFLANVRAFLAENTDEEGEVSIQGNIIVTGGSASTDGNIIVKGG